MRYGAALPEDHGFRERAAEPVSKGNAVPHLAVGGGRRRPVRTGYGMGLGSL